MGRVDRALALLPLFGMAADEENIGRRDHLPCRPVEVLPGFDVALPGLRGVADELQVARVDVLRAVAVGLRSEEHTSELQSLMRISYAVFCLKKKKRSILQCEQLSVSKQRQKQTQQQI